MALGCTNGVKRCARSLRSFWQVKKARGGVCSPEFTVGVRLCSGGVSSNTRSLGATRCGCLGEKDRDEVVILYLEQGRRLRAFWAGSGSGLD